jgi:hypothetical protein
VEITRKATNTVTSLFTGDADFVDS